MVSEAKRYFKVIPVKNIYYMLSYAFKALKEKEYKSVAVEEFENIYDLLASIISVATNILIKRGLGREYIPLDEITSSPRGKIDVSYSIKCNLIFKQKLKCEYDEFSIDTYQNQILKTTINLLLKTNVNLNTKKKLKVLMMYLKNVTLIDYHYINWNFNHNRSNKHYELLMSLCYLVLKGMLQTQSDGTVKLMDFIDEQRMCRLYEKFILEFYKKECSWLEATSSKINWQLDNDFDDLLPNMQSDIMLSNGNGILIIDAKYYQTNIQERFDKKSLISANLYQIFTYVKNKQYEDKNKIVSGMLLYAKTEDEIQPDNEYLMSGNKISVETLDLNNDFNYIKEQLLMIANMLI